MASRVRRVMGAAGIAAVLAIGPAMAQAGDKPVVSVQIKNPTGRELAHVPVTFGRLFRKGDLRGVVVTVDGKKAAAQFDGKRKYDDGSWRFGVVSLVLEKLPAGGQAVVALSDCGTAAVEGPASSGPPGHDKAWPSSPPVSPLAQLLETDFDAAVALKFPDGVERSASARKLLEQAGGKATTWLAGPVVNEWLVDGPLLDKSGQPDPDLFARFEVRAYAGCTYVRVSVVVENCWDDWAGHVGYDAAVTLGKGAKAAYAKQGVRHRRLSRWRKVFWWPADPPQGETQAGAASNAVHDLAYLVAAGVVPNYDTRQPIAQQSLARLADRWAKADTDIMGSGSLTRYMPTTGGRPEIGPYPDWTAVYLRSMDPRAKAVVLGNADLAGSWPIHVRSRKTARPMTLDDRPDFWINGYKDGDRYTRPHWRADRVAVPDSPYSPEGKVYHLSPDVAHQGSFACVPYLVTGDYYYLEEAYFWANYVLLAQWSSPRQNGLGLMCDQIRGDAWGLRNIADAAFLATDGDPEAEFFDRIIRNNIDHLTAKMLGPPEYNKLGFWGIRSVSDARIQNAANPNWMITAPWEHDFLIWSLHHLTQLGWAGAAKPRDFQLRWRVGVFIHPKEYNPLLGAPYRMAVGEKVDGKVVFYEDWKRLGEENARLGRPGLGYDYSAQVALAVAVDAGFPGAVEALKVLDSLKGKGMANDPGWAIVPRK